MESRTKKEAEQLIEEQKVSPSQQAKRRLEVAPGMHEQDRFGRSDEPGTGEYYPSGDLERAEQAPDFVEAGGVASGPDEGMTGIGNKQPRGQQPSLEELDRDSADTR